MTYPANTRDIYVEANGLRHHLLARGMPGSPPVVMIHGLAGQAHAFDAIATRLAQRLHVYCLDVRGRGESDWGPPDQYHIDTYADDLEAIRVALGLHQFALAGTSMGGLISIHYAAAHPGQVTRVVLNDIGPELDPAGVERIRGYVGHAPEGFPDMKSVVRYYKENYGPMLGHLSDDQLADFARWNVRKADTGIYVWKMDPAVRSMRTTPPSKPPWDAFRAITCPVLILRGALSDLLSAEIARRMVEALPGATLVEVPGVGHAPVLSEPEARKALETFLEAKP